LSIRRWFYVNLQPAERKKRGLSPLNRLIVAVICLAVIVAILESEPSVHAGRERLFLTAELIFGTIFLVEYLIRIWISAENPAYGGGWRGYLRYIFSPWAIIDLLAMSTLFLTFFGNETSILRLFRLLRILSLAKLGRYSSAIQAIGTAVKSRRYELLMSLMIAGMLLLISSTLLYMLEGEVQPRAFGSIPRAMWWSIATLTTVGYGDVIPQTVFGKILAGLTAITGIGLIAMPTGILAAAFSDAIQQQRERQRRDCEDRDT
jgi:voltage-gated potassium channel